MWLPLAKVPWVAGASWFSASAHTAGLLAALHGQLSTCAMLLLECWPCWTQPLAEVLSYLCQHTEALQQPTAAVLPHTPAQQQHS
jgi:hypothetical protein